MIAHKERFEEKYCPEPNTGCWLWTACVDSHGYGMFWLNGKLVLSHRVAYELYKGPIPDAPECSLHDTMSVCHTCDNPLCVNPAHLFLGTHQDNMKDMYDKDKQPKGEEHGNAKLTEAEALEIYHAEGTQTEIAKEYGVAQTTIGRIKNKQQWGHIHDEA